MVSRMLAQTFGMFDRKSDDTYKGEVPERNWPGIEERLFKTHSVHFLTELHELS